MTNEEKIEILMKEASEWKQQIVQDYLIVHNVTGQFKLSAWTSPWTKFVVIKINGKHVLGFPQTKIVAKPDGEIIGAINRVEYADTTYSQI